MWNRRCCRFPITAIGRRSRRRRHSHRVTGNRRPLALNPIHISTAWLESVGRLQLPRGRGSSRAHRGKAMISRDRRCVFVADYHHEAALVISLLAEESIDAAVVNDATLGGLEGVVSIIPRAGIKGLEVWVNDVAQADRAREVLARRDEEVTAKRAARAARSGSVDVQCPACRKISPFPASEQGTVQECPRCGEYLDVPEPDESLVWPEDFGRPEDADGGG